MPADRVTENASTRLSAREFEVLEMAARGMTNSEIAACRGVTVHAIKFHLASIHKKLGVGNRTEAAVAYLKRPDLGRTRRPLALPRPRQDGCPPHRS